MTKLNTHVPGFYWTMAPHPTQLHGFSMYLGRLSILAYLTEIGNNLSLF